MNLGQEEGRKPETTASAVGGCCLWHEMLRAVTSDIQTKGEYKSFHVPGVRKKTSVLLFLCLRSGGAGL